MPPFLPPPFLPPIATAPDADETDAFAEADRAFAEFRRLSRRVTAHLAAARGGRERENERVALIDDLQAMHQRLRAAQVTVRGLLRRTDATHAALTAYRRAGALPRRA